MIWLMPVLHLFIGSTLAGSFVIAALAAGFDTLQPILIAAFMIITELVGDPAAAWAQIVAGLVPLMVGIVLLVRFLRRYPVIDEEALMAEAGDDRS